MSGEIYSYLFPELFKTGALDVYLTNIYMKKNRPAQKLSILCSQNNRKSLEKLIFRETTTLGIRRYEVKRSCLKRKYYRFESSLGEVTIKAAFLDGEQIKFAPEYEECKKIAADRNIPLKDVYDLIIKEAK